MVKPLGVIFIFLFTINVAFSAEISFEVEKDNVQFTLTFDKGYSNLNVLDSADSVIFSFETSEKIDFKQQDFFDLPLKSAYLQSDSYRKKFIVTFNEKIIEPVISRENRRLVFTFPFPAIQNYEVDTENSQNNATSKAPSVPGVGAYFKMLFGLSIVLFIILAVYWLVKSYYKKRVFTDIPGSGRMLGKVDLDIRKSLVFYEIGDTLYIIGITDNGMNLIDKVTDEAEATKIRAGFTRKREFTGYMSFFKRKNELDDEISTSNALVQEKLKSLQKK